MFVAKDFARRRFLAMICANSCAHAHFGPYLRDEAVKAVSHRILGYEHWNYPKEQGEYSCRCHGGEHSCRCHGKRVISAPSKLLKLKLAGHILIL